VSGLGFDANNGPGAPIVASGDGAGYGGIGGDLAEDGPSG